MTGSLLLALAAATAPPPVGSAPPARPRDEALRQELLRMEQTDQAVRTAWVESGIEHPDPALAARMPEVDRANTARMKAIVAEHGWPGVALVGPDGAEAAFLLVQHADLDPAFQEQCLALVEAAWVAGDLPSGQDLALLTDRVLVARGKPQRYGSQIEVREGRMIVKPVEDEAHLDERRAKLGLPPMNEYLKVFREFYKLPPEPATPPAR